MQPHGEPAGTNAAARQALAFAAEALGFSACRIAPAIATPYAPDYRRWIAKGCHASMQWMERQMEKRLNPALVLGGARSIAVLSYDYASADARNEPGRIARYAQGSDYHRLIESKLVDLDDTLQGYGGEQRCYVDSGPVNERDYALLAGLGWRGRHGQIIRSSKGSLFFLATILTTLALPTDEAVANRCGSCRRCESLCPGGALKNGLCDARRCLSYWTIEHKGSIPERWRIRMGDRLYGCDICLEACPWNRFATSAADARLLMPEKLALMPLRDMLSLSGDEFTALFRHSPIRRIKREGLLRNACCVLGNTGGYDDLPALRRATEDAPLIAEHARWAQTRILARTESDEAPSR